MANFFGCPLLTIVPFCNGLVRLVDEKSDGLTVICRVSRVVGEHRFGGHRAGRRSGDNAAGGGKEDHEHSCEIHCVGS